MQRVVAATSRLSKKGRLFAEQRAPPKTSAQQRPRLSERDSLNVKVRDCIQRLLWQSEHDICRARQRLDEPANVDRPMTTGRPIEQDGRRHPRKITVVVVS
jgi:hypothetical protein